MPGIKLFIFDLDGTLVDAYAAIARSFNYTMQRLGYPAQDAAAIRQAVGWGDANLLKPFIKTKDLGEALSIYRRHHRKALLAGSHLFPCATKVLVHLRNKGYKVAVASNRPTAFSGIIIRHLGLDRYLDYVLCADKLRYAKPHPEILRKIMQRFSVKPAHTVYVGDMAIDAQAGRRAGVKTVIVTTGSSTRGQLGKERPWRIIGGIKELLKVF